MRTIMTGQVGGSARASGHFTGVLMRKLACVCAVTLGILVGFPGCGEDSGDRLVLSFVGFSGEGINQADQVFDTHAEVDVCGFLCLEGDDVTAEPYTQTTVVARFLNRGKADIFLDKYTLFVPGSGIEEVQRSVAAIIPGGRCATDTSLKCGSDFECPLGLCTHQETTVSFLLYNFDFKDRVVLGRCPEIVTDEFGFIIDIAYPDDVIHQELTALLTFSGVDDREERYTVSASYPSSFDNFDACEEEE